MNQHDGSICYISYHFQWDTWEETKQLLVVRVPRDAIKLMRKCEYCMFSRNGSLSASIDEDGLCACY